jgi:hypothetical protein
MVKINITIKGIAEARKALKDAKRAMKIAEQQLAKLQVEYSE